MVMTQAVNVGRRRANQGAAQWRMAVACGLAALSATAARGETLGDAVGPDTVATCRSGTEVCAAVARGNLWACQFHPEKSGDTGLRILANFVAALAPVPT